MTIKSTISIIALIAALTNINAFFARPVSKHVQRQVAKVHQRMQAEGRLSELSPEFLTLVKSFKNGTCHCDDKILLQVVREAHKHHNVAIGCALNHLINN